MIQLQNTGIYSLNVYFHVLNKIRAYPNKVIRAVLESFERHVIGTNLISNVDIPIHFLPNCMKINEILRKTKYGEKQNEIFSFRYYIVKYIF